MAGKMTVNKAYVSCDTESVQETKPTDSATFMQRIGLCLLALILCVGLMPSLAWAADDDDGTFSVALTIVNTVVDEGESADVVYNEAVSGMTDSMTVADLLEAAGFSKVDTIEETADNRTTYYDDYSWPAFLGLDTHWVPMFNGLGDQAGATATKLTATLAENGHYQYIYGTASTFSYTDDIPDPLPSESDDGNTMNANPYDEQAANTLLENLKTRFSVDGRNASLTNQTSVAAAALKLLGLSDRIDSDKAYTNFRSYLSGDDVSAGVVATYVLILTSAGTDCAQYNIPYNGGLQSILEVMESLIDPATMDIYSAVWILGIYGYGHYEMGADCAMSIDDFINLIMNGRNGEGLFGSETYGYDSETTAEAIIALLPYANVEGVADAIGTAVEAIQPYQNDDGGYCYSDAYPESDPYLTAWVVTALTAYGDDVIQDAKYTTADGSSPIGYLTAEADEDLTGYTTNDSIYDNEPLTAATVFMALASTQAVESATGTDSGDTTGSETEPTTTTTTTTTTTPSTTTSTSTVPSTSSSSTPNTTTSTSSTPSNNSTLAQTGDTETPALALAAGAVALCALAGALVAARRMRKALRA